MDALRYGALVTGVLRTNSPPEYKEAQLIELQWKVKRLLTEC
jgi:hypothetical protein